VTRSRSPLLRRYLLAVGALLLGQGAVSLLVRAAGHDPHATSRLLSDPAHATIHVIWGAALLVVLALRAGETVDAWAAVAFGVFYVGLLLLGLAVHHPFGLMIDGKENAFHAVIGPPALILGLRALATGQRPQAGYRTEAR
jgi:hypothetical protein